jgi:hypothetical protein
MQVTRLNAIHDSAAVIHDVPEYNPPGVDSIRWEMRLYSIILTEEP